MDEINNIKEVVTKFVSFQKSLMDALCSNHPDANDIKLLFDFPRQGQFLLEDELWTFRKHGAGFAFQNTETKQVVDVHKYVARPKIFDPCRIENFLSSMGCDFSIEHIEGEMERLVKEGFLTPVEELYDYYEITPITSAS